MAQIKNIGLFTSGGDAPGMNAAIRAVVRTALYHEIEVTGIRRGFEGMISGDFFPLNRKSVSNIIQRGGTILKHHLHLAARGADSAAGKGETAGLRRGQADHHAAQSGFATATFTDQRQGCLLYTSPSPRD